MVPVEETLRQPKHMLWTCGPTDTQDTLTLVCNLDSSSSCPTETDKRAGARVRASINKCVVDQYVVSGAMLSARAARPRLSAC